MKFKADDGSYLKGCEINSKTNLFIILLSIAIAIALLSVIVYFVMRYIKKKNQIYKENQEGLIFE